MSKPAWNSDDFSLEVAVSNTIDHIIKGLEGRHRNLFLVRDLIRIFEVAEQQRLPDFRDRTNEIWHSHQDEPDIFKVFLLAILGDNRIYSEVISIAEEGDFGKTTAIRLIGHLGELRAIPALVKWLESDEDSEVEAAALSLSKLRHSSTVPNLATKLTVHNWKFKPDVIDAVERALKAIGSPEATAALAEWYEMKP